MRWILGVGGLAAGTIACAAAPASFLVPIRNRKVDPALQVIRVSEGDSVEMVFTTDEPVTLHLHGYDRMLAVKVAEKAVLRVTASITGRFVLEAHEFGSSRERERREHVAILYLEVYPR